MSIFESILRLLFGKPRPQCPSCGDDRRFDGTKCSNCKYPKRPRSESNSLDESLKVNLPGYESTGRTAVDTHGIPEEIPVVSAPTTVVNELEELDVSKFSAMSTEDASRELSKPGMRFASTDFWGAIPSSNIPRVQVINQTMVGLGLITPEELVEIHKIGGEFEEYRTDYSAIRRAGNMAVTADRNERARIKEQKKAEARERKRLRAAEIENRRRTDIYFLGRGVSKGLADRESDSAKLEQNGIPILSSPADVATALELSIPQVRWLSFHSVAADRVHYVNFEVPKKSGGKRVISAPHRRLAAAQNWILRNVLNRLPVHESAHGFVQARSIVTNAQPHVGAEELINVDLKDFFPSINVFRVIGLFRSFGYSPAVATIFALLCTEAPRRAVRFNGKLLHVATSDRCLPQGASTSPAISNLVARHLDHRLQGMAEKLGWKFTRYADDISFSRCRAEDESKDEAHKQVGYVLARIRHIAQDEGFEINHKKTRVLRSHTQQSVTGVVVNERVGVSRKTVRQLRAILHNAKLKGLESQNRDGKEDFAAWLGGMISFVEMVNRSQGQSLRKAFNEVLEQ